LGFLPLRFGLSKRGRSTRESGQILAGRGFVGEGHKNRRKTELKAGEREKELKMEEKKIIEKHTQETDRPKSRREREN